MPTLKQKVVVLGGSGGSVLNTVTTAIVASAGDGRVRGSSAVFAVARSTSDESAITDAENTAGGTQNFGATYYVYRGFLLFDTSIIPDIATVTAVTLTLTATTDASDVDFDVVIRKHDWSAQNPIGAGNRELAFDNCLAASSDLSIWRNTSGLSVNTPYTSGALDTTWVSKTGFTYYSYLSSRDIANTAPGVNTNEVLIMAMSAHATAAYRPTLTVTYTYLTPNTVFFGDSITGGTGASDAAHRWVNIVAAARGWANFGNAGVVATVLQNTVQNTVAAIGGVAAGNGRDTYATRVNPYHPERVFILYGLNDLRLNDVAFTAALFQTDLGEIVDGLIAAGTPAGRIIIGSPPYIPAASYTLYAPYDGATAGKFTSYIAACAAVALAKGTRYKDIYAAMVAGGGDTLIDADGIHPNDSGHAVIAAAFLSVV